MKYIQGVPQSGLMYQHLQTLIAANYAGLGPNNVSRNPYKGLTGVQFQKPLSGSTTQVEPLTHRSHW
jgi:hypothetical protein